MTSYQYCQLIELCEILTVIPNDPPRTERQDAMPEPIDKLKAEFFKTLGHPARIRILEVLADGEHSVGELMPKLGLESSHLSQQLAVLRRAGTPIFCSRARSSSLSIKKRARCRPAASRTPSRDSSHSAVSTGSRSGNWLGSPSLITLNRSVPLVVTLLLGVALCFVASIFTVTGQ